MIRDKSSETGDPARLGDGDKLFKIVTARKRYFVLGRLMQSRKDKYLLHMDYNPTN
jgi:hypothetical protein